MGDFDDWKLRSRKMKAQLVDSVQTLARLYRVVELGGTEGLCNILTWEQPQVDQLNAALVAHEHEPIPDLTKATIAEERAIERARRGQEPKQEKGLCMTCGKRQKMKPKRRCYWCYLAVQPIELQIQAAEARRALVPEGQDYRARVPQAEWPEGERWCSGCQGFVPLDYCRGSRCRAHASLAAHEQRLGSVYGITREQYEQLLKYQGYRCYICRRQVHSKRLAVDHDHATGEVRGLLCADSERGCNHKVVGLMSGIDMAKRVVEYLEDPPARRVLRPQQDDPDRPAAAPFIDTPF